MAERQKDGAPLPTIKLGGLSPRSHLNARSKGASLFVAPR